MSSYLLAFVVSDLDFISNEPAGGETQHRVWVRPDSTAKAYYALDNSIAILKTLEEYVGFDYELPKMDSVGVPQKGGAMENWGLITYRENAMIFEENPDDISHTQRYSGVSVMGELINWLASVDNIFLYNFLSFVLLQLMKLVSQLARNNSLID